MKLSSKAITCQQELRSYINQLDIAGYLREEVFQTIAYMNYYKSQNLWNHKEDFAVYLQELDEENSRLMGELIQSYAAIDSGEYASEDCSYYLADATSDSFGNLTSILIDETHPEIAAQTSQIINTLKAMLLFTITEYLHASALRMGIHSARKQLQS